MSPCTAYLDTQCVGRRPQDGVHTWLKYTGILAEAMYRHRGLERWIGMNGDMIFLVQAQSRGGNYPTASAVSSYVAVNYNRFGGVINLPVLRIQCY